ncbi:MAG: hypothetical protein ACREP1_09585 [Rhodanobacteraceae bacterium]
MNLLRSTFLYGSLTFGLISAVTAQTADDLALLKKMNDADLAAPASRMTSTVTDRDSGAVLETIVVEQVKPDQVHFLTTQYGKPGTEMISDGKRSLERSGPNEPWKALPMNLSEMMKKMHNSGVGEDQMREQHARLKLIGDDKVGGVAAHVYEISGDTGPSKIWLATDDSRLLKLERDYDGTGPIATPKFDGTLKSLKAQLKAATTQRHLHSVTTCEYDPSIKITMPPQ